MAKDKDIQMNGDEQGEQGESVEEKYEKDRIAAIEAMPAHFKALFGRQGNDLAEVARINPREKVLFATQEMLEDLTNPERRWRASRTFRESYLHFSIAEGGEGRDDIKIIGEQIQSQENAAKRGQGFG